MRSSSLKVPTHRVTSLQLSISWHSFLCPLKSYAIPTKFSGSYMSYCLPLKWAVATKTCCAHCDGKQYSKSSALPSSLLGLWSGLYPYRSPQVTVANNAAKPNKRSQAQYIFVGAALIRKLLLSKVNFECTEPD